MPVTTVRGLTTRMGSVLSQRTIGRMDSVLNYLEVGRWMRAKGFRPSHRVSTREQLFDRIGAEIADKRVLYLEFGVYQGNATRYWSRLLRNPESRLLGFDSFEGLPEDWTHQLAKQHFSTQGNVPVIDDPRIRFLKGWFNQTLPAYQPPSHDVLVVNLDADLYSSTDCVLRHIEPLIQPGTFLYFDEFHCRRDELRAFDEFLKRTRMDFTLFGAVDSLGQVAFRRSESR